MALYKFVKSLGNKRQGVIYSLLPSAGAILTRKGYVIPVEQATEQPKNEKVSTFVAPVAAEKDTENTKKRGRKPKK